MSCTTLPFASQRISTLEKISRLPFSVPLTRSAVAAAGGPGGGGARRSAAHVHGRPRERPAEGRRATADRRRASRCRRTARFLLFRRHHQRVAGELRIPRTTPDSRPMPMRLKPAGPSPPRRRNAARERRAPAATPRRSRRRECRRDGPRPRRSRRPSPACTPISVRVPRNRGRIASPSTSQRRR